jgi:hypothetical protein
MTIYSSETLVLTSQIIWNYNPEDHIYCTGNLLSCKYFMDE